MAEKKSILLRISPELWEGLNRWARDELRSLNAQIEYLLRDALRRRTGRDLDASSAAENEPDQPA
ncbi:MAG: Arc family DNA binding domain-containing protein [Phycisphaerae bacterium]|nr:Arc family DNA binding domain-containing protein [Phycisphaerae bacterium]